jgi:hypothetical protein
MIGIQETKDVLTLVLGLANGVAKSITDDGKFTIGDIQHFTGALFLLAPAFTGIENVPHELAELSEEEIAEVKNLILNNMPEIGDKWEAVAGNALLAAWHVYEVMKALKK